MSAVLIEVIAANQHNHRQQTEEQLIHRSIVDTAVDLASHYTAQNAATYHHRKEDHREFRNLAGNDGEQKAVMVLMLVVN